MEAGGSKLEGKQASDGSQGGKGGEKGKKKEKKAKMEKKMERVAKGSDGGQESRAAGLESGGPIAGGDSGAGTAKETQGQTRERKPKKQSQTQSRSKSLAPSKPPVTPSKRAPSLGPGPSLSKKAKASVSKLRQKTPSVSQNAKFANDVGVTPSGSIKVYHPLSGHPPLSIPWASALEVITTPVNPLLDPRAGPSSDLKDQIIKALEVRVASLEKQVERIPDLELQLSSMARVVEALREQ
ncbi:hypothetical protein PAXRUDRAFT_22490, partial [Paxillus rubicundulus Ve08.2h10]